MITVMDSRPDSMKKKQFSRESCLDSKPWHFIAGNMVQIPPVNSLVFYFPQGHIEHANVDNLELPNFPNFNIPSMILCRVVSIKYSADNESDEVYAKIRLIPLKSHVFNDYDDVGFVGNDGFGHSNVSNDEKPNHFAKTLTQSDANNGGGFSVPRFCAETVFPKLDYNAEPPVQAVHIRDVHGEIWQFRHIYRGTPRRHLLTTGWSNFVNRKKLVAGDSIVFMRDDNGDLCLGIRRGKRGGIAGGCDYTIGGWGPSGENCGSSYGGGSYSGHNKGGGQSGNLRGKEMVESAIEDAKLAANGEPFEVIYYPRSSTPEFFVKASAVRAAMRIQWCPGMRYKMAFETEDSSRISWFMGTVSAVQVVDPVRWPNSPWRLLQVAWDEPDLLEGVTRVSPWLVELVSNIPSIHLSPMSPPRKRLRLPQQPDLSFLSQLPMPPFSTNSLACGGSDRALSCIADSIRRDIQGARHAHYGPSPLDLFPDNFQSFQHPCPPSRIPSGNFVNSNSTKAISGNSEIKSPRHILLFGQVILSPDQSSQSSSDGSGYGSGSGSGAHQNGPSENLSEEGSPQCKSLHKINLGLETSHCKVYLDSEHVGRTLDLSVLGSYQELYKKLAEMFGTQNPEIFSSVVYGDASGLVKHIGDEPFGEFLKSARRLTILSDSSSDNLRR